MKDETKHAIAKQIAFAVPLLLLGVVVFITLNLLYGGNPFRKLFGSNAACVWMFCSIPVVLGYCYRLYKWVMKWK